MTTYELEDHEIESVIDSLREGGMDALASKLEDQVPKEQPVLIGAIVQTREGQQFLRWARGGQSEKPWIWLDGDSRPEHVSLDETPIAKILERGHAFS